MQIQVELVKFRFLISAVAVNALIQRTSLMVEGVNLITTIAGNCTRSSGYSGDGDRAIGAQLNSPFGVAVDPKADIYIADYHNNVIRKVNATSGIIYTIAGNNTRGLGYSGDGGPAASAQLYYPSGVAFDVNGNMYIADCNNQVIRKMNSTTGIIDTIAGINALGPGYSGDGGPAILAQLSYPNGVAFDARSNLYISDYANHVIRKINATTGIIYTIAGNNTLGAGYSGDGGAAVSAQLYYPSGVAVDVNGNAFIADYYNNVIRKVNATSGNIYTIAGKYALGLGYSGDNGLAVNAQLNSPTGVAVDTYGNLYIADEHNNVIRGLNAITNIINTIAGNNTLGFGCSGDGGLAASAQLYYPTSVAVDSHGNLYIADEYNNVIRKVTSTSAPITLSSSSSSTSAFSSSVFALSSSLYISSSLLSSSSPSSHGSCASRLSIVTVDSASVSVFPFVVDPSTFSNACFYLNESNSASNMNNNRFTNLPPSVAPSVAYTCIISGLAPNLTQILLTTTTSNASLIPITNNHYNCQLDPSLSSQALYCDVNSEWIHYQITAQCSSYSTSLSSSSSSSSLVNQLQTNSQNYIFVASFDVSNINTLSPLFSSSSSLGVAGVITQYILYVLYLNSSLLSAPFTVNLSPTSANVNASITKVTITFAQSASAFPLYYNLQSQLTHNNSLLGLTPLGSRIVPHSESFSYSFVDFVVSLTNLSPFAVLLTGAILVVAMLSLVTVHRRYYPRSSVSVLCASLLSLLNAVCCAGYFAAAYTYAVDSTVNDKTLDSLCMFAIATAVITAVVNLLTAIYCVTKDFMSSSSAKSDITNFSFYVRDNIITLSIVSIISCVDVSNMMLISARIFYLDMFSASLSQSAVSIITVVSCLTCVLLSAANFIISAYVCTLGTPNFFTLVILGLTGLSILAKFVRLYLYVLLMGSRRSHVTSRSTAVSVALEMPATNSLTEKQRRALADAEAAHRAAIKRIITREHTLSEHENPLGKCGAQPNS